MAADDLMARGDLMVVGDLTAQAGLMDAAPARMVLLAMETGPPITTKCCLAS